MRRFWFVATYKYEGIDGKMYYCALAQSYIGYCPIAIHDKSLCDLRVCETKKGAELIARHANDMYRERGNLATSSIEYKLGV